MEQTGSNSYPPWWRLETRHGWSCGHVMSPLHNLHSYAYTSGVRSTLCRTSEIGSSSSTVEYKVDISSTSIRRNPIKTAMNHAYKSLGSRPQPDSLIGRRLLQNRPHHLITQFGRFGKSRRKVGLDPLESVPIGFKVAE